MFYCWRLTAHQIHTHTQHYAYFCVRNDFFSFGNVCCATAQQKRTKISHRLILLILNWIEMDFIIHYLSLVWEKTHNTDCRVFALAFIIFIFSLFTVYSFSFLVLVLLTATSFTIHRRKAYNAPRDPSEWILTFSYFQYVYGYYARKQNWYVIDDTHNRIISNEDQHTQRHTQTNACDTTQNPHVLLMVFVAIGA